MTSTPNREQCQQESTIASSPIAKAYGLPINKLEGDCGCFAKEKAIIKALVRAHSLYSQNCSPKIGVHGQTFVDELSHPYNLGRSNWGCSCDVGANLTKPPKSSFGSCRFWHGLSTSSCFNCWNICCFCHRFIHLFH